MSFRGLTPLTAYLGVLFVLVLSAHLFHPGPPDRAPWFAAEPDPTDEAADSEPLVRPTEVLRPSREDPPGSAVDPEAEEEKEEKEEKEEEFRVPDIWCGNALPGRERLRLPDDLDPDEWRRILKEMEERGAEERRARGKKEPGVWMPTGEEGIYRRVVKRWDGVEHVGIYEYGRRVDGTWQTWSREAEWERRRRAAEEAAEEAAGKARAKAPK